MKFPSSGRLNTASAYAGRSTLSSFRSGWDSFLTISTVLVLTLHFFVSGNAFDLIFWSLPILTILAWTTGARHATHITSFCLLWSVIPKLSPWFTQWPLSLLAPLIFYLVIASLVPSLRRSLLWWRAGRFDFEIRWLVSALSFIAAIALTVWVFLAEPDLRPYVRLVAGVPNWALPIAGLTFAMGNALMEEIVFRGIVFQSLEGALGNGSQPFIIQGVLFGLWHYQSGIPRGVGGFFMVTLFGIALAIVRRRAEGLLAPWLVHVFADLTIFVILVFLARGI